MWTSLLFASAAGMFLLPLMPALLELRLKRDIKPVTVDQANAGNIDYFAESFQTFITDAINDYQAGETDRLVQQNYSLYEHDTHFQPTTTEAEQAIADRLIVGFGELFLPAGFNFNQEIFGKRNVNSGENCRLRSVLALENLVLGKNTQLLRWAHARNIFAASGCVLLGRVSAEAEFRLQPYCQFARINANPIFVDSGNDVDDVCQASEQSKTPVVALKDFVDSAGRVMLDNNLDFPEHGSWQGDMVIKGNALIRRGAYISGSLKVYGNVLIEPGVEILGAIISNKTLTIATDCLLNGPLVAEQIIEIDNRCRIGRPGVPSTVTAPIIRIASGSRVYGSLWARERGEVVDSLSSGQSAAHPNSKHLS